MRNKAIVLLLLFALILLFTACTGEESKEKQNQQAAAQTSQSQNNLEPHYKLSKEEKEKVHLQIRVIREDVDSGESYVTRIEKYDKEDRLLSVIDKNEKGEVSDYEKYQYDKEGRLIKKSETKLFMGDKVNVVKTYSYNKDGKKTGYIIRTANKGSEIGKGIYEYYANGNLKYKYTEDILNGRTKKFYYNKEGEKTKVIDDSDGIFEIHTISYFEREYDEQGRKIKETEIKKIKETGEKIIDVSHFNKFGKITKAVKRNEDGIVRWFEWEYDKNGNRTKFISKDSKGNIEKIQIYYFDKSGNRIKRVHKEPLNNGQYWITLWFEYEYNENNKIIKFLSKGSNGEIGTIEYYKYKIVNGRVE
jgi:uncharacterized protein (DUF2249 family)